MMTIKQNLNLQTCNWVLHCCFKKMDFPTETGQICGTLNGRLKRDRQLIVERSKVRLLVLLHHFNHHDSGKELIQMSPHCSALQRSPALILKDFPEIKDKTVHGLYHLHAETSTNN